MKKKNITNKMIFYIQTARTTEFIRRDSSLVNLNPFIEASEKCVNSPLKAKKSMANRKTVLFIGLALFERLIEYKWKFHQLFG